MLKPIAIASALLATAPAFAHGDYDFARVVSVRPHYVQISQPAQKCWTERVSEGYGPDRSYAGAVIGGLAGGILGNQIGGGNGRTAATAVGAATGALMGDRLDNRYDRDTSRVVQQCRTVDRVQTIQSGYDVVYRYRGATYTTVTDYDPGYSIRVPVTREVIVIRDDRRGHDRGKHRGWDRHHRDWDDD